MLGLSFATREEWINEFEGQSLNRRNSSALNTQLVKNVLVVRDSPCINPLTLGLSSAKALPTTEYS